jgi:hypothetical protein
MMKIVISTATTLMAAAVLVACNGATGSDITSGGATQNARATCSSLANWQSVGIGMSSDQVQARLGVPSKITTSQSDTTYSYEACRGFKILVTEAIPATATTPAVDATYSTTLTGGTVSISGARGVTNVKSPDRIEEKVICEWDFYNYPYAAGQTNRVCRTPTTQF